MDKEGALRSVKSALAESDMTNPNEYSFKSIKEGMVHIEKRIEDFDITLRRLLIIFDDDPKNESRKGLISLVHSHDEQIKALQNTLLLQAETAKNQKIDERVRLVENKVSELEITNRIFSANTKQWVLIALSLAGIANFFIQLYFKYK